MKFRVVYLQDDGARSMETFEGASASEAIAAARTSAQARGSVVVEPTIERSFGRFPAVRVDKLPVGSRGTTP